MSWLSWDHFLKVLGVLGFVISVYNLVSTVRNSTVNAQPALLAELRGYLEVAHDSCRQVRPRLKFDRWQLENAPRPDIPPRPTSFDDAIRRMPELGSTINSVGQDQISILHMLIRNVSEEWERVKICLDADPVNTNALEFAPRLERQCRIVEKYFPDYIDAVTRINKGNLWKRYKYRDHRPFTYKLSRWTPLARAVSEYDRSLMET